MMTRWTTLVIVAITAIGLAGIPAANADMRGDPLGACCHTDGTCTEIAEASCTGAGGTWFGEGSLCDPSDCNSNGTPDMCDIASGASEDINNNSIPDECEAALSLNPASPCFGGGIGDTITIHVDMTNLPGIAVGAQFFIEYDTSMLDFVSITPGESPFLTEIDEGGDEGLGHIDYGVGIPIDLSLPGTSDDTTIAIITFEALQETCDMSGLISFRPTGPHGAINKLSGPTGEPIVPVLYAIDSGVIDGTAPTITCPADQTAMPSAGECEAFVTVPAPIVDDNCDVASVINDYNGTDDASDTYPAGATVVTWTVTDTSGNTAMCTHTITVLDTNELVVDVELDGVVDAGPFDRCITFELFNCTTAESEEINALVTFVNGIASAVLDVPCGEYSCITARDRLHTLRRTIDPLPISGTQYVASFTAADGNALIGGNLNDDGWIDVLDFGIYTMTYGYCSPDTDCSMMPTLRHGDVTGDGLVEELDFSFIQNHWLQIEEPGCCPFPIWSGDDSDVFARAETDRRTLSIDSRRTAKKRLSAAGPITRISVIELHRRGLGELSVADLNQDGWLDDQDVQAHAAGVRP